MPAGQGIVEGGEIPYTPAAAAKQKENFQNRLKLDPEVKCYMPGIPRANYHGFPFQIIQSQQDIAIRVRICDVEPRRSTWASSKKARSIRGWELRTENGKATPWLWMSAV